MRQTIILNEIHFIWLFKEIKKKIEKKIDIKQEFEFLYVQIKNFKATLAKAEMNSFWSVDFLI